MTLTKSFDGFWWYQEGDDDHLAMGGHETNLGPILASFADPNRDYVNVGAHVGTWAIRLASQFRKVWAVEANPNTVAKLADNIAANHLGNVDVLRRAAWDTDFEVFSLEDEKKMRTGGSTRLVAEQPGLFRALTTKLDSSIDITKGTDIALISMDVEGAEAHVLRGAQELIARDRPNMVIELHDGHPGTDVDLREQVYGFLDSMNYDYSSVFVCPPEEHLICTPKEEALEELKPSEVPDDLSNDSDDAIMLLRLFTEGNK